MVWLLGSKIEAGSGAGEEDWGKMDRRTKLGFGRSLKFLVDLDLILNGFRLVLFRKGPGLGLNIKNRTFIRSRIWSKGGGLGEDGQADGPGLVLAGALNLWPN